MLLNVYRQDGIPAAIWEIAYQLLRPVLTAYSEKKWRWYRRKGRCSVFVNGYQLFLLPNDKGVSVELAVHRTHEPRASQLLSNYLRAGMTVVDVGSNLGYYALLESYLVGPRGKVIAIEPVPQNAELCERNIGLNRRLNVVFRQIAISNQNATLPVHVSDRSNWHSLNPVPWPTRDVWVTACTLDALVRELSLDRVDLIRMDLEGYEVQVLDGMGTTIRQHSPRLLVEIHPQIVGTELMRQYLWNLHALGYSPAWVLDQERDVSWRWRFLSPEKLTMQELIKDWRINIHPRSLTVMFARDSVTQAGDSSCAADRRNQAAPVGA
jgi:FkbM family methyltransferase